MPWLLELYPPSTDTTEYTLLLVFDILFIVIAAWWIAAIQPLPKTYLSEIIFPVQFWLRGAASMWLAIVTWVSYMYSSLWDPSHTLRFILVADSLAWTLSSSLIWMAHRRNLHLPLFVRSFWIVRWLLTLQHLVASLVERSPISKQEVPCIVFQSTLLVSVTILAVASVKPHRQLTPMSPEVVALTLERFPSFSSKSLIGRSMYGSFGASKMKSSLWLEPTSKEPNRIDLKVQIPSWTLSRKANASFVSYKILVLAPGESWTVRRRYSDFRHMRRGLPEALRQSQYFPEKSLFKSFDPRVIDSRRAKLEKYLNFIVAHPDVNPQSLLSLCDFLELEYVVNADDCQSYLSV
ncbi:hypothetical protein AeRB84_003666 [Aphanomyces euteiches]|nr:hypothetical protein AeRB84_003666 [Aphanomyces euteiches]